MSRRSITLALLCAACGGSAAPAPETAEAPLATAPPPASSPGGATTAPAASAAPVDAKPVAKSPFYVIGQMRFESKLFDAGERAFVASDSGIIYALEGDEVIHDPLLWRGFNADYQIFGFQAVTGRWPDAAWLATTHPAGRSGYSKLWRWDGKRWVHRQSTVESRYIVDIRSWIGGRQLAVEQAGMMFDSSFLVVSGDKNVTLPVMPRIKNPESFCWTPLRVEAFEALPSGEVFAAGVRCGNEGTEGLGVLRWARGAKDGVLESLPGTKDATPEDTDLSVVGMAVRSPNEIYVAALSSVWNATTKHNDRSQYLAQFDGTRWQRVASKLPHVIETLVLTSDRQLLATTDHGELYRGTSFADLAPIALPAELAKDERVPYVHSVWSHGAGELWAIVYLADPASERDSRPTGPFYVLHTRPATKPLPTADEYEQKERAYRLPGPLVEWCQTPFVLLYTLGKKAPADYDYPSTRAALKGQQRFAVPGVEFIEFERMGTRFFGARVPDFELGKALMKLVKDKVPGSTPELVCHDPPPLRKLALDLTGSAAAK